MVSNENIYCVNICVIYFRNVVVGLAITLVLMLISFLATGFVFSDGDGYPVDMIGIINPETPNEYDIKFRF